MATPTEWIRKDEVLAMTGASYTSVFRSMTYGDFPKALLHFGKLRWRKHEIEAWLDAQPSGASGRDCVKANTARARKAKERADADA